MRRSLCPSSSMLSTASDTANFGLNACPYFDGGGGDSQTEPAKIGTAAPYFLKVPFEASHLSFGNANIISYFRRIGDFLLLSAFKRNFLYFVLEIGTIVSKIILGVLEGRLPHGHQLVPARRWPLGELRPLHLPRPLANALGGGEYLSLAVAGVERIHGLVQP